jgi:hypothetical protein
MRSALFKYRALFGCTVIPRFLAQNTHYILIEQTMCRGRRSDGRRGSASGGSKTIRVRGYRRANGTYVAGYTRSMYGSGSKSKSTTTPQKLIDTDGSTTPPGQAIPRSSRAAASFPDADQGKTVHVRAIGYTRSNGTCVAGYMRSLPSLKGGNSGN